MNVKTKIRAGLIFLLAIIILLACAGSYYVNKLADESEGILKDNYNTLQYTKKMIEALDNPGQATSLRQFEENLLLQEHNITENGEVEATTAIRNIFETYKNAYNNDSLQKSLRDKILLVQQLNMDAILHKNNTITNKTKTAFAYITILGTLCFLLSFTFVINFPKWIADPIARITEGIRKIAVKDYSTRIEIQSRDEFGEVAAAFNNMASELDKWEHSNVSKLMFEKSRIEAIINNMHDAVLGMDEKRNILFINEVAQSLLMLKKEEIVGRYAPDIALKNDLLRNLLADNQPADLKIYTGNKENYFVKNYKRVMNEETVIGELIVLHNVTPFKELDYAKTNFLATVSHELKTPIAAIKMSLKLLNSTGSVQLSEEQKQLLDSIADDTERLLKITSELLNMTQIETGNIQLNIAAVDPGKIIELSINAVSSLAEQKNIRFEINMPDNLPMVTADSDKTVWVMVNLLTNAIKYSPENSTITIDAISKNDTVLFKVKDHGPGIANQYTERVFERYFKIPGSKGGTGLGLAISREFIEAQKGKIWVDCNAGEGATFAFILNKYLDPTQSLYHG